MPPSLKHLCFQDALPVDLHLQGDGCSVALVGQEDTLCRAVQSWPAATKRQVSSLRVRSTGMDMDALFRCVSEELPALQTLAVNHCQPMSHMRHLAEGLSLANLYSLHAEAVNMKIVLPALPRLRRLCLRASGLLAIVFEDAAATAAGLEALEIGCAAAQRRSRRDWGDLEELLAPLECSLARHLELVHKVDAATNRYVTRLAPQRADLAGWEAACGCHCCLDCLTRAGAAF